MNKTERFFVGRGISITENTIIPIKEISAINVYIPSIFILCRYNYNYMGTFGLCALCVKGQLMKSIGIVLIIVTVVLAGLSYFVNTYRVFALHIQTYAGFLVTAESKELDYIRGIKGTIFEVFKRHIADYIHRYSNHTWVVSNGL